MTEKLCKCCNLKKPINEFRKWRNTCRQCLRDSYKDYRLRSIEKRRQYDKSYYYSHKEYKNKKRYEYHMRDPEKYHRDNQQRTLDLKKAAFEAYGGCRCMNCDKTDLVILTIDHINGNGIKHRKEVGPNTYRWLKKNNYPKGYQVLCFNCNCTKNIKLDVNSKYYKLKLQTLNAYGGCFCASCGERNIATLTLDHVNNNGNIERKLYGKYHNNYHHLRKLGFPPGRQVLCFNCNFAKSRVSVNTCLLSECR
jgi:hypothetical protein